LQETEKTIMIIITGAAGFIGSNLLTRLNADGYNDIVLQMIFQGKINPGTLQAKLIL
jgi:ADP-L-glycero-D-manno-heptose 6-epimerase